MLKVFFVSQSAHLSYSLSQWLKALVMLAKKQRAGLEQDLETRHLFATCDATFSYRMLVVTEFISASEKPRRQNPERGTRLVTNTSGQFVFLAHIMSTENNTRKK